MQISTILCFEYGWCKLSFKHGLESLVCYHIFLTNIKLEVFQAALLAIFLARVMLFLPRRIDNSETMCRVHLNICEKLWVVVSCSKCCTWLSMTLKVLNRCHGSLEYLTNDATIISYVTRFTVCVQSECEVDISVHSISSDNNSNCVNTTSVSCNTPETGNQRKIVGA